MHPSRQVWRTGRGGGGEDRWAGNVGREGMEHTVGRQRRQVCKAYELCAQDRVIPRSYPPPPPPQPLL